MKADARVFLRDFVRDCWPLLMAFVCGLSLGACSGYSCADKHCVRSVEPLANAVCDPGESWEKCLGRLRALDGIPTTSPPSAGNAGAKPAE